MTEIPKSKHNVKLFRRFPDDKDNEKDFGPGYIKLYAIDEKARGGGNSGMQVVFRSHGTMKVRAAHVISPLDKVDDDKTMGAIWESFFDVSFENELRYVATGDTADMVSQTSACYGKEQITRPIDFPLSFEFESDSARDGFVDMLKEQLDRLQGDDADITTDDGSRAKSNSGGDLSKEKNKCNDNKNS